MLATAASDTLIVCFCGFLSVLINLPLGVRPVICLERSVATTAQYVSALRDSGGGKRTDCDVAHPR